MKLNCLFSLIASCLVICIVASPAKSAIILDQQYETPNVGTVAFVNVQSVRVEHSQTFTVGMDGLLSRIELRIGRTDVAVNQPLLLDIRTVVSGMPSEANVGTNILSSMEVAASSIPVHPISSYLELDFVPIDLTNPIDVAVGEQYAVVLRTNQPSGLFSPGLTYMVSSQWESAGTSYSRGSNHIRMGSGWEEPFGPSDLNFRTYVAVPEPSVFAFSGIVGAFMLRQFRRRAKPLVS